MRFVRVKHVDSSVFWFPITDDGLGGDGCCACTCLAVVELPTGLGGRERGKKKQAGSLRVRVKHVDSSVFWFPITDDGLGGDGCCACTCLAVVELPTGVGGRKGRKKTRQVLATHFCISFRAYSRAPFIRKHASPIETNPSASDQR